MAAALPEKYRATLLIEAAMRPGEQGAQLARLYLQRAYKLADEDYAAIPAIEREIRDLRGEGSGGSNSEATEGPNSGASAARGGPDDGTGDAGGHGAPDTPARPENLDPGGP